MIRLAIIEDDHIIRRNLVSFAQFQSDIKVIGSYESVEQFLEQDKDASDALDLVLLDIGLQGMTGLEGIQPIIETASSPSVVMLTTYDDDQSIMHAINSGAKAYFTKRTPLPQIMDGLRKVQRDGHYYTPMVSRVMGG